MNLVFVLSFRGSETAVMIEGSEPRLRFNDSLDHFGAGSGAAGQIVAEAVGSSLSLFSRTLISGIPSRHLMVLIVFRIQKLMIDS